MDFLNKITKDLEKSGIEVGKSEPPRYWFSTGNYVLNRIISGDFKKGIPQGRITAFSGPSGAGKSFLVGNAVREAQQHGAFIVVLDSENALDDEFMSKIGVDVSKNYYYVSISTIPQTKNVVSQVIKGYANENEDLLNAQKVLIVIDSLDMLMTETEEENFDKGVSKGDQGQRNKQLKAMLREFVQAIKTKNISMIVTDQPYKNQDPRNGEGTWIVSDAIRFSLSQIVLLTKLKMRDKTTRIVDGIFMRCEGFKTRFTKPFQTISLEVPYDTGMNKYSGLIEVAVELGVLTKKGSRYSITGNEESWYAKNFDKYAEETLDLVIKNSNTFLTTNTEDAIDVIETQISSKSKRQTKAQK